MQNVLAAWDWPSGEARATLADDGGLINQTYWVRGADGGTLAVLQRLNTGIFRAEVHHDIEAVTAHVEAAGLVTPRLRRTRQGALWHTDAEGGVWRVLSVVGDRTVHKLQDPADARSAGRLVARFHSAVRDLRHDFQMVRPSPFDTDRQMRELAAAVAAHPEHRLHADVARVAEELVASWERWSGPQQLPERVVHGDLKISNVRFTGPRAVALIDLDTFARRTLDVELGDAMRSWCNPLTEESLDAHFDVALFAAAMEGYAAGAGEQGPSDAEWEAVVPAIERVALGLAARFAKDALEERYFGWREEFGGRGEHNLVRARGQAALARSVRARRAEAEAVIARAR
ncbi:MAG: phosphotransferase [Myxococcales bacterium]|nr:phosphotransferase [Myxococcales bacterium]